MVESKEAPQQRGAVSGRQLGGIRPGQGQKIVLNLASNVAVKLLQQHGSQIEGGPGVRDLAHDPHGVVVAEQGVQAHPGHGGAPRGRVHVVGLMQVPEDGNRQFGLGHEYSGLAGQLSRVGFIRIQAAELTPTVASKPR